MYALITRPGYLSIRLLIILGLILFGALTGFIAVLKGIVASLVRSRRFEPAVRIPVSSELELSRFVTSICNTVGSLPPNSILIHAEPTFYVTHGKIDVLNGRANGRILALGLPLMSALTKSEFSAVLAHEFAHFTGGDTVYSSFVLPVYAGTITAGASIAESIKQSESFSQSLPLLLPHAIISTFFRIFHYLDMHIFRAREKRADTIAAIAAGGGAFKLSLMKICGVSATFWDDAANRIVSEAMNDQVTSHYSAFRMVLPKLTNLANEHFKRKYNQPEDKYDSHPSLKSRLDSIPNTPNRSDDKTLAVTMLAHLEEYENQLGSFYDTMKKLNNVGAQSVIR
ncbi:MAG: M48 family metalloprotease [Armatimonadota bacterium]